MPDLSKITVDGTDYNVKDAVARAEAAEATQKSRDAVGTVNMIAQSISYDFQEIRSDIAMRESALRTEYKAADDMLKLDLQGDITGESIARQIADQALEAKTEKTQSSVDVMRGDFEAMVDVKDHFTAYDRTSSAVTVIPDTWYNWDGKEHTNTSYITFYMRMTENCKVYSVVSSTIGFCVVFSAQPFSQTTRVQGWDKNIWPEEPFTVEAGQYVAVSARTSETINAQLFVSPASERTVTVKPSAIPKNVLDIPSAQMPTDALLYADRLPSYYIDRPANPASFQDAMGYIDRKIAAIPKHGKQFIFIADTHWAGNEKHSTDLIQYVRKRTGIRKVVFGGDVFGGYNTKYEAAAVAADYLNQAKRAFGQDWIPVMGDHDNNTVNAPADAFLPYSVISPLFVDTLERTEDFHCCQPGEKLSQFATVGSEDYNEAMAFFRTVYYVDDNQDKIRYISLNCGNNGDRGAMYNIFGESGASLLRLQLHWLADTLMHTPTGYDVIVICHKLNYGFAGNAGKALEALLTLFLRKEPGTVKPIPSASTDAINAWIPRSTTFDFSEAPDVGRIICLMGHTHYDSLAVFGQTNGAFDYDAFVSSGTTITQYDHSMEAQNLQIPIINTTTDSLGAINTGTAPSGAVIPPMTADTVTEQAFDVVTITDSAIILTRFGAGDDRTLYFAQEPTQEG